jgi:hypothetical protein
LAVSFSRPHGIRVALGQCQQPTWFGRDGSHRRTLLASGGLSQGGRAGGPTKTCWRARRNSTTCKRYETMRRRKCTRDDAAITIHEIWTVRHPTLLRSWRAASWLLRLLDSKSLAPTKTVSKMLARMPTSPCTILTKSPQPCEPDLRPILQHHPYPHDLFVVHVHD